MKHALVAQKPNAVALMMVGAMACVLYAIADASSAYDNDMWWIIATGREIVQNGIPYTNPFVMHEGLHIVIQQWLSCVVSYSLYESFGIQGIRVLVFAQSLVLAACLYALCRVCSRRKTGGGEFYLLIIVVAFGAFAAYSSVRPHLYSMTLFALVLLVMEEYRQRKKPALLVALPILAAVHVNLHAAMAPYDLVIIAVYLLPDVPSLLKARGVSVGKVQFLWSDYPRIPVLIALLAAMAALLANPYGIDGALYTLNSYGAASYGEYINEMGATDVWTSYGAAALVTICFGCLAMGRNGLARINAPLTLLFVAAIPLSLMHTRNVWLVALFAIPLVAQAVGESSLWFEKLWPLRTMAARALIALCLVGAGAWHVSANILPKVDDEFEKDSPSVPTVALDWLDKTVEEQGVEKTGLKLYNTFNCGGYVEWRGYKAFVDPRPELLEPGITGVDVHYYQEFVDFAQSKTPVADLIENYNFDYIIANNGSDLADYLIKQDVYHVVEYGEGYRLWAK